jgi:hypothetical protein
MPDWDDFETNTVTITPRGWTPQAGGGVVPNPLTPRVGVSCSIQKPKYNRVLAHEKEDSVCSRTIFFTSDASVAAAAGIGVGWMLTDADSGLNYYVLSVGRDADAGVAFPVMYAVDVEERK